MGVDGLRRRGRKILGAGHALKIFRVPGLGVGIVKQGYASAIAIGPQPVVAIHHGRRGNQSDEWRAMALALSLIVDEEESLVLLDGTAQGESELVEVELLFGACEIAP